MATPAPLAVADSDWRRRAAELADHLVSVRAVRNPLWRDVIAAVPRHVFAPHWWGLDEYNAIGDRLIDGDDPNERKTWLDGAYADRALITQWRPGTGAAPRSGSRRAR